MSTNTTSSAPGNSGVRSASAINERRSTALSCWTCPWVNPRRNLPSVEGARTWSNTTVLPACRSRSVSSIESAPATIPATSDITFAAGFSPGSPPRC